MPALTTTPTESDEQREPLETDHQLRERVIALIGPAYRRQLWPIFLDRDARQIPILVPVSDLPERPATSDVEAVVAVMAKIAAPHDLAALAFAIERPGRSQPSDDDRAFARQLDAACRRRAITMRGVLLVHDEGVRLLAAHEYRAVRPPAARASTRSRVRPA